MACLSPDGVTTMTLTAWVHIVTGVLVLAFAVWRLALRVTRGVPAAPAGESNLMKLAGEAGHWALYALMLAMPITGLLAWYGGVTSLAGLHGDILKVLLIVMIGLHVVAALYHQFMLKDNLLNRMRKPLDQARRNWERRTQALRNPSTTRSNSRGLSACSQCPAPVSLAKRAAGNRARITSRCSGWT